MNLVVPMAALLAGCTAASVAAEVTPAGAPARPTACSDVPAGTDLQAAVDAAPEGAALCLGPGRHAGPLRITRPLTLWGGRDAVIASTGQGTTVAIAADRVRLLGMTVDGSGHRFDLLDAAVHVQGADDTVDGVEVRGATFGILVERARRAHITGNLVRGNAGVTVGMRGDSIRLWETTDSVVERNRVLDGRDVVVWYSQHNRIEYNRVERARYGTHLMYSSDCEVVGNQYRQVAVGVFVMYSHRVGVRGNLVAGATEMGLGLKDSGDVTAEGNGFVRADMGMYLDGQPPAHEINRITGNAIRLCEAGIVFHSSGSQIELSGNELIDNAAPVRVEGRGDALGMTWDGNYFDDYVGYDLDGDGRGDLPYELRSMSGDLIAGRPGLAFFRGAPSLELADAVTHMVPVLQPQTIVVDQRPLAAAPGILEAMDAH